MGISDRFNRRRVARPIWGLGIGGIVLALSKLHAVWNSYDLTSSSRFAWAFAFIVVLWLVGYGFGIPDAPLRGTFTAAMLAAVFGILAVSLVQLFVGDALLPRFVVFGTGLLAVPWNYACAAIVRADRHGDTVLVVGAVDDVGELAADLAYRAERPATIVGMLGADAARGTPDDRAPVVTAATRTNAGLVVLARDAQDDESILTQAAQLHERGIRVRTLLAFSEDWLGKLPLGDLERISVLFDIGELHLAGYARLKRLIDVLVATVGSVLLLVVLPFVLFGDLVANRGPLFFGQPRVGRAGHDFRILKFRTMRGGGGSGAWTEHDDVRVTPFGRLLRRTHLDELPQMLNVLRGDVAIVGPRPEQPHYVAELREKIPFYDVRHLARPGITGWAQVKYHYGATETDALEKLQYEIWYLRHQSLLVDARILFRTLRHVVGTGGH